MNTKNAPTNFPLLFLHPVADATQAWVAMLLDADRPLAPEDCDRLFGALGLADALSGLPCLLLAAALPAADVPLPAGIDAIAAPAAATAPVGSQAADLRAGSEFLARHPGCRLALKVDTTQLLQQSLAAGYSWLAGNYPLHPAPGRPRRNDVRHALLLELLIMTTHDADAQDIERLIKRDAQLSYQLLRLVNSVAFSLDQKISSFAQAITVLGMRQLQRWVQLLLYASPETGTACPLMPRAAMRAALMETLGGDVGGQEQAFMAGMFSLLDLMLNTSVKDIVAPLHLPEATQAALLEHSGPLGRLLRAIEHAEAGERASLAALLSEAGIDNLTWATAVVQAYRWAIRVSREA